jgi:RNA polymerase sigma-70 factor, ECF subfamily
MDTERQVVAAAAAGDRHAFDELVERHRSAIHQLTRTLTQDDVEAEDLVQETFIRAFRAIARFRGDSSFRTWLHRIAVNVIRSHRTRPHLAIVSQWSAAAGAEDDDLLESIGSGDDLEGTVLLRCMLDRALTSLPPRAREVVVLRDVQGFEYQEIATLIGAPIGTVESRIFRARRMLRPLLAPASIQNAARATGRSA